MNCTQCSVVTDYGTIDRRAVIVQCIAAYPIACLYLRRQMVTFRNRGAVVQVVS